MRSRAVLAGTILLLGINGTAWAATPIPATPIPATPAAAVGPPTTLAGGFDFTRPQVAATGLEVPWGIAVLPDGSALVAERNRARIMQVRPGTPAREVARVQGVVPAGEGGLLGIAVAPTFAQDNLVYAYFTAASDNRIVRFRLDNPQSQQPILTGIPRANIHDGGRIAFGPDGNLYAGTGDANQTGNAQNPASLGGKILRMTPTGGVPPGNPGNSVVYSLGHRNVQGLAWDNQRRLYATEFGQNTFDEVNMIVAGGNYGWPVVEGRGNDPRFRNPIVVWTTAQASPSGAAIANNTLFAAALRGTRLWLVPLDGNGGAGTPTAELNGRFGRLRSVALGSDGFLWVTTSNRDGRGSPAPDDDRVIRFPPEGTAPPPPPPPTPPGGNLALNRPATGSAPCAAAEGPAKAVNGSVSGGNSDKWCSLVGGARFLQVDLGSTRTLTSFVVRHAQAGRESASFNTRDFDLQVSANGTAFTTVAQVRGNTAAVSTHQVNTSGRFIRLNVINGQQTGNAAARIYEFEAYGTAA